MITLIVVLVLICLLLLWSSSTTCSLRAFEARAAVRSQVTGAGAYARLVNALLDLPGIRLIERDEQNMLISAMPVPSSMERGFGLFVVARHQGDEVVLLGRDRLPLPTAKVSAALRQLDREARMRCGLRS